MNPRILGFSRKHDFLEILSEDRLIDNDNMTTLTQTQFLICVPSNGSLLTLSPIVILALLTL